jgi:hypothetical protein
LADVWDNHDLAPSKRARASRTVVHFHALEEMQEFGMEALLRRKLEASVGIPLPHSSGAYQKSSSCRKKTFLLFRRTNTGGQCSLANTWKIRGVAMGYRSEIVPLAVMGSLTAAIMVVFAVTVMH